MREQNTKVNWIDKFSNRRSVDVCVFKDCNEEYIRKKSATSKEHNKNLEVLNKSTPFDILLKFISNLTGNELTVPRLSLLRRSIAYAIQILNEKCSSLWKKNIDDGDCIAGYNCMYELYLSMNTFRHAYHQLFITGRKCISTCRILKFHLTLTLPRIYFRIYKSIEGCFNRRSILFLQKHVNANTFVKRSSANSVKSIGSITTASLLNPIIDINAKIVASKDDCSSFLSCIMSLSSTSFVQQLMQHVLSEKCSLNRQGLLVFTSILHVLMTWMNEKKAQYFPSHLHVSIIGNTVPWMRLDEIIKLLQKCSNNPSNNRSNMCCLSLCNTTNAEGVVEREDSIISDAEWKTWKSLLLHSNVLHSFICSSNSSNHNAIFPYIAISEIL